MNVHMTYERSSAVIFRSDQCKKENTDGGRALIRAGSAALLKCGGKSRRIPDGSYLFFDRKSDYSLKTRGGVSSLDVLRVKGESEGSFSSLDLVPGKPYKPDRAGVCGDCFGAIVKELSEMRPKYEEICVFRLFLLSAELLRAQSETPRAESRDDLTLQRFNALRRDLEERCGEQIPIAEMAASVNLSPSRFFSVYKSFFGVSPKKDLQTMRVKRAARLLESGEYSVAQTAKLSGYGNVYHFIRQFKAMTGVTPGKYASSL